MQQYVSHCNASRQSQFPTFAFFPFFDSFRLCSSYIIIFFSVSTVAVGETKISNIGPTNLSGVIDIENKLSPLSDKEKRISVRSSEDKLRKQDRDKRRQEMEKRKDERKKEQERRRLEREREKATKQSSPKRLIDLVSVPDLETNHEEFKPWEDVDEAQSSPRSDVTVSGMVWVFRSSETDMRR